MQKLQYTEITDQIFKDASDFGYDTLHNNLLLISPQKFSSLNIDTRIPKVIPLNNPYQELQLSQIDQEDECDHRIRQPQLIMRFSPANSQKQLIFSPSLLTVTAISVEQQLAVTNIGFDSGVHYWEV